jgi:hypothetical protein
VCCKEGKLSSSTFPLSSLLKWIFFAARRHSSTPREERTTEREREREREDSFGCRKNQHFIQNPHMKKKKKKKALVAGKKKQQQQQQHNIQNPHMKKKKKKKKKKKQVKDKKKTWKMMKMKECFVLFCVFLFPQILEKPTLFFFFYYGQLLFYL